jgi:prepilin-type N-terminal cleavage/methylation domain-containing protein
MNEQTRINRNEGGFSLMELLIAMVVTLVIAGVACTLLAESMKVRTRSNDKIDALADAQRALNIMSREIANAGFNLDDNGLVAADSITDTNGNSTIRVRANLNKFDSTVSSTAQQSISVTGDDAGEDIKYFLYPASNTNLLARYDRYATASGTSTVLANRLDSLHVHYYGQKVTYSTSGCDITGASASEVAVASAKYIVIAVCVNQPAVGAPNSPGYQPSSNVLLVSDVALRNANLTAY